MIVACATLIAAFIAYLGSLTAKDLKTSEYRQAWIDEQRRDIAIILARSQAIALHHPAIVDLSDFDEAFYRIQLRENPKQRDALKEWRDVIVQMHRIRSALVSRNASRSLVQGSVNAIVRTSGDLLKIEWDRVRNGEQIFRKRQRLIYGVLAAAFVVLIAMAAYTGTSPPPPAAAVVTTITNMPSF